MRSREQKKLRQIRRKVEEVRWLLEPLSAENIGAPSDKEKYAAPHRMSQVIAELALVEEELRNATHDADHWFNVLVSDPNVWTHPWHHEKS